MFSQLSEQMKKSTQPVSDLFAANVEALQAVSNQQASFVSGFLQDSIKLVQTVAQQTDTEGFLAAQTVYAESVRERLTSNAKLTYSKLNVIGKQVADGMRTSFESASVQAATPVTVAPAKIAAPKKAMPTKKAAIPKTVAPKVKAKVTSAKKAPVIKATAPVKAPVKAAVTKATAAKPTVAKELAAQKPATVKAAAKLVPKLSADNVRAIPKSVVETKTDTTSTKKH
ncbi:MAG: phasin family protein [Cycloclasticus sp.]